MCFCYPKFHVLGSYAFSSVILCLLLACGKSTLTGELVFDWIKLHFNVIDMLVHVFLSTSLICLKLFLFSLSLIIIILCVCVCVFFFFMPQCLVNICIYLSV